MYRRLVWAVCVLAADARIVGFRQSMLAAGRSWFQIRCAAILRGMVREDSQENVTKADVSPLSLSRLREAFAAMLGAGEERGLKTADRQAPSDTSPQTPVPGLDLCEINPRSVV